jgi:tetratricopeptide (TPR) repeat protein
MKSKARWFAAVLLVLAVHPVQAEAQDFKDTREALTALKSKDFNESWKAMEYLAARPKESTAALMRLVEKKADGWILAMQALARTRQEKVILFYIRLLQENFYNKEESGQRIQYGMGSKYGCTVLSNIYGSVLARHLGELGDARAIPVLKQALIEGDSQLKEKAYWSLYKLGAFSLDDLFQLGKGEDNPGVRIREIIMQIGWEDTYTRPDFALEIFQRVVSEFPNEDYYVASAYFWQAQCFALIKQYDRAIQACNEVLKYPQFNDMVVQATKQREELIKEREGR